ncbi:hypothetical protein PS627_01283 [Pseudomonas fluorescens]|nr:hypothetical protein PS627_01283 [Pseudomonas fluorescens]
MSTSNAHSAPVTSALASPHSLCAMIWTRPARRTSTHAPIAARSWSRYERLSFSMLGCTWGILILAVSALHLGNYGLDTRTSSTSGSHSGFHESARALKSDIRSPQTPAPEGNQP